MTRPLFCAGSGRRLSRVCPGNGGRSENGDYLYNKKRLHEIDRRVRYLIGHLCVLLTSVCDPLPIFNFSSWSGYGIIRTRFI